MAATSAIEWTDATWNPVTGCSQVSPGCAHCYAKTFAERWRGIPGHHFEQGFDLRLFPERLLLPMRWEKPRRIFVNSMSDLFHEDVPDWFVEQVYATIEMCPQHEFQILTKRPERQRKFLGTWDRSPATRVLGLMSKIGNRPPDALTWPPANAWHGTSVELQRWLDIRGPELLETRSARRFLSIEPCLGPIDLDPILAEADGRIGWIIVGGESGPGARPFNVRWALDIVRQCQAWGVPVFVKQLGAKPYIDPAEYLDGYRQLDPNLWPLKRAWQPRRARLGFVWDIHLRSRKGNDVAEWPEALRVREMPLA